MSTKKMVYSIYGYINSDAEQLAGLISEELAIELTRDDNFSEDEGPYVFIGKGDDLIDYLCIRKQFRVGDEWENNYHKICPLAIEINFTLLSGEENIERANNVRIMLNKIIEIKEIEFSITENPTN
ncbi:hypothetical protein [Psychroserpens luteus]|uniref:Uncharacterized protein n=1 Tax=Psychroserpens luteus TaxID=1434066 RepID=A0ABW5ZVP5_9FLAO|nr:hypothetical protein [Psychroserpens luteus]